MILNSLAILVAFVGTLRLLLAVLVLTLAMSAWRASIQPATPDRRTAVEDRCYLLFLLTLLLLGLNLVSWPLLYLLLQSYVPEWSGVMCIYGVMQVGIGSIGSSRFLPGLLGLLQWTKPVLVFAGGAWFVVYLINRNTRSAPLLKRLFIILLPVGLLAVADAAADLAYVAIPKKEAFPTSGCCTGVFHGSSARFLPQSLFGESVPLWLHVAYYGGNGCLILALVVATSRRNVQTGPIGLAVLLLGGVAVMALSGLFLIEVAAPALLQLPHHHCPYDLVPQVPEAVVAVTFFLGGCFFLGWAGIAQWLARCPETEPFLAALVRNLLRMSLWGYVASLVMLSLALALV